MSQRAHRNLDRRRLLRQPPRPWLSLGILPGLWLALSGCQDSADSLRGARQARQGKVLVLGLDGMDHGLVQQLFHRGKLPNMARLARQGGFKPLTTSTPPQSPTAWANFITGMRPGHHGIFDFIQRDPTSLAPYLSTSRVFGPRRLTLGSWALPLGSGQVELLRKQKPFWWYLSQHGVAAMVIKIPSHFPPRDDGDARVLSGMGTPDILGTYGTFSLLTTNPGAFSPQGLSGGRLVHLTPSNWKNNGPHGKVGSQENNGLWATLEGPADPLSRENHPLSIEVQVTVDARSRGVLITLGDQRLILGQGEWSPLVPINFTVFPLISSLRAMARLYLKSVTPEVVIYISPLNIDPLDPALPISSPPEFSRHLAQKAGRFYTQGMAEDTKALASGALSPEEFLQQATLVLEQRKRMLDVALAAFDRGFLFFYFSSTDQITHMFYRAHDKDHPARRAEDEAYAQVVEQTYGKLDQVVGQVMQRLGPEDLLLVMSDHGFGPASYLFDLNTWLHQQGYLSLRDHPQPGALGHLDWPKTQAYAMGLNGLYLNLKGREAHGVVPSARREVLLERLERQLLALHHPESGQRVVTQVTRPRKLYPGPEIHRAPDLIVGYGRGFKVADASAQGGVGTQLFEINHQAWSGDHCGDSRLVPGILLSNRPLISDAPALTDLPATILTFFNIKSPPQFVGRSVVDLQGGTNVQDNN